MTAMPSERQATPELGDPADLATTTHDEETTP